MIDQQSLGFWAYVSIPYLNDEVHYIVLAAVEELNSVED